MSHGSVAQTKQLATVTRIAVSLHEIKQPKLTLLC